MNYADPFSIQEATPLSRALRNISLQKDTNLNWPSGYTGSDYLASINLVTAFAASLNLNLPNVSGADSGTGFIVYNQGQYSFNLNDSNGVRVTAIDPGQARYVFCQDINSVTAPWKSINFGQGSSLADAVQLAGSGLSVTEGKLSLGLSVTTTTSNTTVNASYRGKIVVNTGGSMEIGLPRYSDVGNNFFFGVHNSGSGTLTVRPATSETVDDATALNLSPNESLFVFCSGTSKWYTIGYGRSTQFQFTKLVKDITAGGTITLTSAEASNKLFQFIGTPTSNITVILPSVVAIYYVQNTYTGAYPVSLKTPNGNGLTLNSGDRAIVYCDGVNVVSAQSVAVGVNISVIDGSLTVPSVNFSSDPNTGLFKADLHTLGISGNGAEAARFASDKSSIASVLGIGTNNPLAALHVLKPAGAELQRFQSSGGFETYYNTDGSKRIGVTQYSDTRIVHGVDDAAGWHQFAVNNTEILRITPAGVRVFGAIADSSGNSFATLAGNTFTGTQVIPVQRGVLRALGNVSGTVTLDISTTNTFTLTCIGATTLNFTGAPPAGQEQSAYIKITNGNVTWGAMCAFSNGGTKPVPTNPGVDVFAVWYDSELQKYIVGRAYQDYK